MKAILISINPKWVAKILNGEKTLEIRKKFPKDYVGWVYIYCTKDRKQCLVRNNINKTYHLDTCYWDEFESNLNGKVVARFWCDKVEDYVNGRKWSWEQGAPMWGACNDYEYILKDTCLTDEELRNYVEDLAFSAIHISKLEIFDKPMSLNAFYYAREPRKDLGLPKSWKQIVTRPPQSFMFIEV